MRNKNISPVSFVLGSRKSDPMSSKESLSYIFATLKRSHSLHSTVLGVRPSLSKIG